MKNKPNYTEKLKQSIFCFLLITSATVFSQVGIGTTTPTSQAALDIRTTDKGLLIPRLSTTQRNDLGTSLTTANDSNNKGMQVYDTDTNTIWFWNNASWQPISNTSTDSSLITCVNNTSAALNPYSVVYITNTNPDNLGRYSVKNMDEMTEAEAALFPIVGFVNSASMINIGSAFSLKTKSDAVSLSGVGGTYSSNSAIYFRVSSTPKWESAQVNTAPCLKLGNAYNQGTNLVQSASFNPVWFAALPTTPVSAVSSYKPILDNSIANSSSVTAIGRYLVPATGLSNGFIGQANKYADYDGTSFTYTTPTAGDKVTILAGSNIGVIYKYSGGVWTKISQTTPLPTDNYLVTNAYNINDLVINNSLLYQANAAIPANTAFAIGTAGATWKRIGNPSVITVTEQLTIIGTSANPSKGTAVIDYINLVDDGSGWCTVSLNFVQTAGGSPGSGDYLIKLPGGYSFDTSVHIPNSIVGDPGSNASEKKAWIPGSTGLLGNNSSTLNSRVAIYSAFYFKIISGSEQIYSSPTAIRTPWSSSSLSYPLDSGTAFAQVSFRFKKQ